VTNGERFDDVERPVMSVEQRLEAVEIDLKELRVEVGGLRILGEKYAEDIGKVAEVQSHHGKKLEEISEALAPLAQIRDFIACVAANHELRIQAIEKHTGIPR